jgi:hypothetical protein
MEILNFTVYSQTILSALVAILALMKYQSRDIYIKLIGLVFLWGFFANVIAFAFYHIGLRPYVNIPQSIYDFGNIWLISLVYYHALNKRYKHWFVFTTIFFFLFAAFNLIYLQKQSISSYNKFISCFIVISYSIFYFYRLMIELPSTHLQRMPMFWINSAYLIYYAGALILFVFTSYIVDVLKDNLVVYWIFHNTLSIIQHLLILIGVWYDLRNLSAKPSHFHL